MKKYKFSDMPEADVIVNHSNTRLRKNTNTNIFVIGLSGTGKSSTCIRTGELIQKKRINEMDIKSEMFITDSLLDFVRALRKANVGDIIIIEEVSVLFSSRRAMAGENVSINKIMDTCRKKRITIISNAPLWKAIDPHMRAMGHILIETLKINLTQKVVVSKFHRLQTNPESGKTYRHTMQRNGRDVSRMFTRMPSKEIWNNYEEGKDAFMDELYKVIEHQQNKKKQKLDKEMNVARPDIRGITKRELEVHQLCNIKGMTQQQCGDALGITQPRVTVILKNIMKKSEMHKENQQNNIMNPPILPIK